jgi:dCTP deaminase
VGPLWRPDLAEWGKTVILSDREIKAALERGSLRITPDPRSEAYLWSSTALDLRLGEQLAFWDLSAAGSPLTFSPAASDHDITDLITRFVHSAPIPPEGFPIVPGKFYLGWTLERIQLPHRSRLAAQVEGKSSLARLGLGVHVTAPTIHAGFGEKVANPDFLGNPIQLEIWNTGPIPIVLNPGLRVCQLIFEYVDGTPEQGYAGQFATQGPVN